MSEQQTDRKLRRWEPVVSAILAEPPEIWIDVLERIGWRAIEMMIERGHSRETILGELRLLGNEWKFQLARPGTIH